MGESVEENIYQAPKEQSDVHGNNGVGNSSNSDERKENAEKRRYRRTLVHLKRMHENPDTYRRNLAFRSLLYKLLAVITMVLLKVYCDFEISIISITLLVLFFMFLHVAQLCRIARNSLQLNVQIIDWEKVDSLLEEEDER